MKTYFSIVKIAPNTLVGDSISIGMILSDDEKFFVKFSDSKIKIAKTLLGENKKTLDFFISQIENIIQSIPNSINNSNELFQYPNNINSKYLAYLHRYSNNIIQYEEPKYIKEDNSVNTFNRLFTLLIDSDFNKKDKKDKDDLSAKAKAIIEEKLISKVKTKVHTNVKFTNKILPSLFFNYNIECIGLNGVFTGAKSLDFSQSEQTVHKEISNYYALCTMLENTHERYGKANNFYLISDEPNNIGSKEHKLWEHLPKLQKFKLIHTQEVDIVTEKIEETNATTFLDI